MAAAAGTAASSSSSSGEVPLFPPPAGLPSDPAVSAAIAAADSWQRLRDLYSATARKLDPGQLLALTQRLAHVTGAVVWPEDSPLPEAAPPGGAPWAPVLYEQEAEEVVALAQTLCRATQVCLPEMYGMQQVAGLLQSLVSLGVAPPPGWLRSAELVALRTQREGREEGGRTATSELLNELLAMAASFQRVGHVPDRSFVGLLGEVRPLEEVQQPGGEQQLDGPPVLLVLAAPQLLCLARAVLLWGLQPPLEWPELFLQATYTRISRANQLAEGGPGGGRGRSADEAAEAAEAEAALGLGGLAALLWAAVMMEARPADPDGRWMAELSAAALRRLRELLAAPPLVVVAATEAAGGGGGSAAAAASTLSPESSADSLQDMVSLLSAFQQMMYDPGPMWSNTCLQAAAVVQARTDPFSAVQATAAIGSPPPGDALAAVLFLTAQYDHPQDEATRGAVVGLAQGAQAWMRLQAAAFSSSSSTSSVPPPASPFRALFSSRGLTQLLMSLVRMGGQPSAEWVEAWAAAAEPLTRAGSGGGGGGDGVAGFDVDQMVAILATAAEAQIQLPDQLQRDMVHGLIMQPQAQAQAPQGAAAGAAAGGPPPSPPVGDGVAVRSLPQFRQLLGILELQSYPLEPDWLEPLTGLVEDFRLRLGPRELLSVLRVLGSFRDTVVMDTAAATSQPSSSSPSSSSSTSSRRSSGPIVLRAAEPLTTSTTTPGAPTGSSPVLPPFPYPSAAPSSSTSSSTTSSSSSSAPAVLDSEWLGSLLEDLKVRGGVGGPNDLMQMAQALSSLSAPPSLLSYVEVFAIALTGEDGRRRVPAPRRTTTTTATTTAATATAGSPAAASATKPSLAKIRLRLQKEASERRGAQPGQMAAGAPSAGAGEEEEEGGSGDEGDGGDEEQQWSLAWPAMLGAFAAAGHLPERRWWDRFAAATLPALESYEGPRLASTAVAALGLSSQAAAAAAAAEESESESEEQQPQEEDEESKLLPSLDWHQQALSRVAEAIRACPVSMDEIRDQAVMLLSEQRQRRRQRRTAAPGAAADDSDEDDEYDNVELDDDGANDDDPLASGAPLEFSADEFTDAVLTLSSQLPMLLEPLAQPRVPLPPQLLELLKDVAEEAVEGAAEAVAAAREGAMSTAVAKAGGPGGRGSSEGVSEAQGGMDLDALSYGQQVVTLVMQILISSDYPPGEEWMRRVGELMLVSRPEWGPGSETGELQQQQHLLLNADQLTSLSYLAGRFETPMKPEQVRLLLQHAARLAGSGELGGGELAATLVGLSGVTGVEVVEEGPEEVAVVLEALASQSGRLSAQGLSEAATALLQLGLGLQSDMAVRFRAATARCLPELTPPQMLTVLTVGGSLGLEPPSRELLGTLSLQVGRLAAHSDPLAPAAATEAAYQVLKWFPEVAPNDSDTYIARLKSGLQPLLGRLGEVVPASAAKLALLMASTGLVPEPSDIRGSSSRPGRAGPEEGQQEEEPRRLLQQQQQLYEARAVALAPLVDATAEGLPDYDNEQLSNAVMGLSLLGLQLSSSWLESFMESSRRQLDDADGRSLAYLLSGLADQRALPDGPYTAAFWSAVRRRAAPPDRDLDLLSGRTLLEAAGQLGMRPDRELMQSVLDCALLRYRESPDPEGLTELVQVMASFSFVPSPAWATEVRSALAGPLASMSPEQRAVVLGFLQAAMPQPR